MAPASLTVVADPRFREYDFGPGHPWNPNSRWLAIRLLECWEAEHEGASPIQWIRAVPPAADEELLRFHSARHLTRVRAADRHGTHELLDHGDTPSFPGCFSAAARVVAGTLAGLGAITSGASPRAFQPGGGLHHAGPDRASGFCVFNDVAVTIAAALSPGGYRRIAYVDIDVHHGDGVMYGFYDRGDVLDIDFHETGEVLFPGTGDVSETGRADGSGLKLNVPLPPGAGDEAFLPLFRRIVPSMIRSYRPELIVLQCGVDAHEGDRLGHLQYTSRSYREAVTTLASLADEVAVGRFLVTGGGGYRASNVSVILAQVGALLAQLDRGRGAPNALPEGWRREFEETMGEPAPRKLDDPTPLVRSPWSVERQEKMLSALERAIGASFRV